jgi:hypothetical protein
VGGILALAVVLTARPGAAQWKDWDYDLDQEKKPWEEMQTQLPPYPKAENLLRFEMGSNTANQYFVDASSLSVGEDDVVRYTLVIRAGGGANNVSFEGMRCKSREVRVYAFGHANGQWSRARNAGWRTVEARDVNGHHFALLRDYFCWNTRRTLTLPLKAILSNLKNGPRYPAD